jgi:hypothetical protein
VAITKHLQRKLAGPCRHASVHISAVAFQPGGRRPRTSERTVRVSTPGCRATRPAVTG